VGSTNFVLIRHEMAVGGAQLKFFTLLFHLDEEAAEDRKPPWMINAPSRKWGRDVAAGEIAVMDHPVAAGELVGHFGEAGKPRAWEGVAHFEIFAAEEIGAKVQPGFWHALDGSRSGRFCVIPEIVNPIDADHSGTLAPSEFVRFFHSNKARESLRKVAVRHLSEWGDKNDWELSLTRARDFGGPKNRAAIHKLYAEQIEPTLWWGDNLGELGLPDDKIVWGYHPITFVLWLHDQMKGQAQQAARGIQGSGAFAGKRPPSEIKDDAEATEGFVDDEDALFGEAAKSLDLEKLAAGYPDEPPNK
jgi:hypothetical protein